MSLTRATFTAHLTLILLTFSDDPHHALFCMLLSSPSHMVWEELQSGRNAVPSPSLPNCQSSTLLISDNVLTSSDFHSLAAAWVSTCLLTFIGDSATAEF